MKKFVGWLIAALPIERTRPTAETGRKAEDFDHAVQAKPRLLILPEQQQAQYRRESPELEVCGADFPGGAQVFGMKGARPYLNPRPPSASI